MLPHMAIGSNELFNISIEIKALALLLVVSGRILGQREFHVRSFKRLLCEVNQSFISLLG